MAKNKSSDSSVNKDVLLATVIALVLGLAGGYGFAQVSSSEDSSESIEMAMSDDAPMSHMHDSLFEVPAEGAPTIDFTVEEDAKSGWNIAIETTNFTFAPNNVNGQNARGEGHAHLYVDGVKVARVYGQYFHYPEDFDGTKTFRIELNANDHSVYAVDGQKIEAVKEISHDHNAIPHNDSHMEDME